MHFKPSKCKYKERNAQIRIGPPEGEGPIRSPLLVCMYVTAAQPYPRLLHF